jgi:hypothetical protein
MKTFINKQASQGAMKKHNLLDVLAWIAFFVVVLYLILRITGQIHSPLTIDLIALISGAYFVGRYAQKFDLVIADVEIIKADIQRLNKQCPVFSKKHAKPGQA